MKQLIENAIINKVFYLNQKYLSNRGFYLGDRILTTFSKEDNCIYIKKVQSGDHKISLSSRDTVKFTDTRLFKQLSLDPTIRYDMELKQDAYDKSNNTIKCLIKFEE